VWTPRRILLLVLGAVAFGCAFIVYNRFLGWIDGLPALPVKYLPSKIAPIKIEAQPPEPRIHRMLRQAFGEGCRETSYPFKINLQSQGILLASDDVQLQSDGRLRLAPFSLAVFGKWNPETEFYEINTIHCDVAYAEFDHKVESISDMARSKIVAAEFHADPNAQSTDSRRGWIHVVHNHATPQADDDVIMRTRGPFYYRDDPKRLPGEPQLWTRAFVEIDDYQSKPPHNVQAQGMNIYLKSDPSASGNGAAKSNIGGSQQVKTIEMMQANMRLTLEDDSSLPTGDRVDSTKIRLPPAEKPFLTIKTLGTFRYDVPNDRARFDVPGASAGEIPQTVEVVRSSRRTGNDTLNCDHLEVQFRKRTEKPPGAPAKPGGDAGGGLALEEVRATGPLVILTSEAEKLHARGHELIFNQLTHQSILRGAPMVAIKEGNKIQTSELVLHHADANAPPIGPDQSIPQARAAGPGTAWLIDRENQSNIEVRWSKGMTLDREKDLDCLTLTGSAKFEDREKHQHLAGDRILVWLGADPNGPAKPDTGSIVGGRDTGRSKLKRVHVIGSVDARTPELIIRNTDLFIIWFQDLPSLPGFDAKPPANPSRPGAIAPAPPSPNGKPLAGPPAPPLKAQPAQPAQKPIEVSAASVEAFVMRTPTRNELDRVTCHDRVHVHQDSDKPQERGLDLDSHTLKLTHTPDGDILELTGTQKTWASVETQEMILRGPEIIFHQPENRARVTGVGQMRLLTASMLDGENRPQPVPLLVNWNERMEFRGSVVNFYGGVQASQEYTTVLCRNMDVYLDRVVSLSQLHKDRSAAMRPSLTINGPGKDDDAAKVRKVICYHDGRGTPQPVEINERVLANGKLVRQQRITAPEVAFYNDESRVRVTGPGEVRLLQWGEKDAANPVAKPAPTNVPVEQELKLTQVRFQGWMEGNTKTKTVKFFTRVRVVHLPSKDINAAVNEYRLGPGAFTLRSDRLMIDADEKGGTSNSKMMAEGHADLQSLEFSGHADTIKYDEGKDKQQQVIFDSTGGSSPAALYHIPAPGKEPREILGRTILYWRKTNKFHVIDAIGLSGQG
jgi:hypothetical protein